MNLRNSRGWRATFLLAALTLASAEPSAAEPRTVGVYFDADGTHCHGTISPGAPGTIYILGKLTAEEPVMCGAEFRFVGLPAGWQAFPVPNPEFLVIGDPFGDGATMAFAQYHPPGNIVPMFTAIVIATTVESDVQFTVEKRNPPMNPNFQCPLVLDCDPGVYAKRCVTAIPCTVNASTSAPCVAPTAVAQASWSAMKNFFR